jgi:chemotaxis protein MotB
MTLEQGRTIRVNRAAPRNRDSESWIYSYADLVTNLLALFVMLLVMTKGGVKQKSHSKNAEQKQAGLSPSDLQAVDAVVANINGHNAAASFHGDKVTVQRASEGLRVSFGGEMLFDAGSAELRKESLPAIAMVSGLLLTLPPEFVVDVEGHTDSKPTKSGRYPSNWELSSARAGSVVRALQDFGFSAERMRAVGLADTQPAASDRDNPSNRRVILRLKVKESAP